MGRALSELSGDATYGHVSEARSLQMSALNNVGIANARKKSHGTHHSSHMPQKLKKPSGTGRPVES